MKINFWRRTENRAACGRMSANTLSMLVDGELTPSAEAHARHHLSECALCRHEYDELTFARTIVSRLPALDDGFAVEGIEWREPADVTLAAAGTKQTDWRSTRAVWDSGHGFGSLRRLLTRTIPVPVPLLVLVMLGGATLLLLQSRAMSARVEQAQTNSPQVSAAPLVIEKPVIVERTIERVVTRYVVRAAKNIPPRALGNTESASSLAVRNRQPPPSQASRLAVTEIPRDAKADALEGFEPVGAVKITLIKEHE